MELLPSSRPMLVPHARYRWDKVRGQSQIVFPEGMLVLNESGAAIVKFLDGRSMAELVAAIEKTFESCGLESDVREFLEGLIQKRLLRDASNA